MPQTVVTEVEGAKPIVVRLQRQPPPLQSAAFASHAFPRDVVEIAGAGGVEQMIAAMQQAQGLGDDDDDEYSSGERVENG